MNIQYAIAFTSDMPRAIAFYRDVLQLKLRFESPDWTEFATDGATLALHATPNPNPAPAGTERAGSTPPSPPSPAPAGTVRIGFNVPDVDAFHARMVEHKVPCTQEPQDLHGARLASYIGPDGAVFGVSQTPKG